MPASPTATPLTTRRADLLALGKACQCHGGIGVVHHQHQHPLVKPHHGQAQHPSQMGVSPVGVGKGGLNGRHLVR